MGTVAPRLAAASRLGIVGRAPPRRCSPPHSASSATPASLPFPASASSFAPRLGVVGRAPPCHHRPIPVAVLLPAAATPHCGPTSRAALIWVDERECDANLPALFPTTQNGSPLCLLCWRAFFDCRAPILGLGSLMPLLLEIALYIGTIKSTTTS